MGIFFYHDRNAQMGKLAVFSPQSSHLYTTWRRVSPLVKLTVSQVSTVTDVRDICWPCHAANEHIGERQTPGAVSGFRWQTHESSSVNMKKKRIFSETGFHSCSHKDDLCALVKAARVCARRCESDGGMTASDGFSHSHLSLASLLLLCVSPCRCIIR